MHTDVLLPDVAIPMSIGPASEVSGRMCAHVGLPWTRWELPSARVSTHPLGGSYGMYRSNRCAGARHGPDRVRPIRAVHHDQGLRGGHSRPVSFARPSRPLDEDVMPTRRTESTAGWVLRAEPQPAPMSRAAVGAVDQRPPTGPRPLDNDVPRLRGLLLLASAAALASGRVAAVSCRDGGEGGGAAASLNLRSSTLACSDLRKR